MATVFYHHFDNGYCAKHNLEHPYHCAPCIWEGEYTPCFGLLDDLAVDCGDAPDYISLLPDIVYRIYKLQESLRKRDADADCSAVFSDLSTRNIEHALRPRAGAFLETQPFDFTQEDAPTEDGLVVLYSPENSDTVSNA